MASVSIRELRNNGGDVVDRAAGGEEITITRSGKPVAALRRVHPEAVPADVLLSRWQHLPEVDGARLRSDLDDVLDAGL